MQTPTSHYRGKKPFMITTGDSGRAEEKQLKPPYEPV
ncbi:hypothetical protein A2U01_0095631, partial [Trifolium medium]|nr:hypothetical protein [Trifolium medium]